MATINIEDVPQPLFERLQDRAQREHRSVSQEVIHILDETLGREKSHSIMELEGLGKELWEGIDPVEYIRAERASWDS
jgi:plasmid stability protein